jgi:AraC family transcriptional regulator
MSTADHRIVERPAFHVVGVRGRFAPGKTEGIPVLWNRLIPRLAEIPDRARPDVSYGVCVGVEPAAGAAAEFDYTACVEVTSLRRVPDGMVGFTVPAGTYAVFTHRGHITGIGATTQRVWREWMPAAGLKPTGAPDFELYDERFCMDAPGSEVDIYVPVVAGE